MENLCLSSRRKTQVFDYFKKVGGVRRDNSYECV
jgi:hypothetical protein